MSTKEIKYEIYIDGSCKPTNPGPAGCAAVVVINDSSSHGMVRFLGEGTNNLAELAALDCALDLIESDDRVDKFNVIYSDSQYVCNLFNQMWKANKNKEQVLQIRKRLEKFSNTEIRWVKAHAGNPFNEEADLRAKGVIDANLEKYIST